MLYTPPNTLEVQFDRQDFCTLADSWMEGI